MIPGFPVKTTHRTIAWELYQVPMCGTVEGCPKGLGSFAHRFGRVDRTGLIHWDHADMRATRRGLRVLFKLLALAHHRDYWTQPPWRRLYLTNVWASKEIRKHLHYNVRKEWTLVDRQKAAALLEKSRSRSTFDRHGRDRSLYMWLLRGGYNVHRRVTKH